LHCARRQALRKPSRAVTFVETTCKNRVFPALRKRHKSLSDKRLHGLERSAARILAPQKALKMRKGHRAHTRPHALRPCPRASRHPVGGSAQGPRPTRTR